MVKVDLEYGLENDGVKFMFKDFVNVGNNYVWVDGELFCCKKDVLEKDLERFKYSVESGDCWDGYEEEMGYIFIPQT